MTKWKEHANKFGYKDVYAMLYDFYVNMALPASSIGKRVGATASTVLREIRRQGINVRSRGGVNHTRWRNP
jgi:hypothetical protein